MVNENDLIENQELRDKMISNIGVLENVKKILLIKSTDVATLKQVSQYYEVGDKAIESICLRHKTELIEDGMCVKSYKYFLSIQHEGLKKEKGKTIFLFNNDETLTVPNRGIKIFTRRSILRIGMLLRDSQVAKEVRTQLLNIEEKTSDEEKIRDITEEEGLAMALGMAQASGDITAIAIATGKLMAFKNRHINQLKSDNEKLTNDKKALSGEILTWGDRKNLNAGVRKLASITRTPFGKMWGKLYKQLEYKYSINLTGRNNGKKPYINNIKEDEWDKVIKSFSAICDKYDQSPSDMFQGI